MGRIPIKGKWKLFALYPLKGWFGWWKVRCVCMDDNANFMDCVTVACFRHKAAAQDYIQAMEVSGYEDLFDRSESER